MGRFGRSPIVRRSAIVAVFLAFALTATRSRRHSATRGRDHRPGRRARRAHEGRQGARRGVRRAPRPAVCPVRRDHGRLTVTDFADETAKEDSLGADDALLLVASTTTRTRSGFRRPAITDAEINDVISARSSRGSEVAISRRGDGCSGPASARPPTIGPGAGANRHLGRWRDGGAWRRHTRVHRIPDRNDRLDPPRRRGHRGDRSVAPSRLGARLTTWREAEERDRRTGQLARQANSGLIAIDDRIRNADQEVGFVEAQYGTDEAAPFKAAVAAAQEQLKGAFEVASVSTTRQPEDPPTREAMLQDIVARVSKASEALDAQAAQIDALRNLERQAPSILAALPVQADALDAAPGRRDEDPRAGSNGPMRRPRGHP